MMWFCVSSLVHMVTDSLERIVLFVLTFFHVVKCTSLFQLPRSTAVLINGKVELAPLDFLILCILVELTLESEGCDRNNTSYLQENTGEKFGQMSWNRYDFLILNPALLKIVSRCILIVYLSLFVTFDKSLACHHSCILSENSKPYIIFFAKLLFKIRL